MNKKYQLLIPLLFLLLALAYYRPSFAAIEPWLLPCPVQQSPNSRAEGLISAKNISIKFGNPKGACVISPQAPFAPYTIDAYEDLKSRYFTQAKSSAAVAKHAPIGSGEDINEDKIDLGSAVNPNYDHLYLINGNLIKRPGLGFLQDPVIKPAGLVFVEGNFSIKSDIGYTGGLVFVVKGDVLIDQSVTSINAVIFSSGTIYTATDSGSCNHNSPVPASQLTIYGSLIALDENKPIEFCRTLGAGNSNTPAELINHQPKYLVILRNLFADTFQRWSEIQ